jgi:hypothetical protein
MSTDEQLDTVTRPFTDILDLGVSWRILAAAGRQVVRCDAGFAFATRTGGVQADEDRLPFADASLILYASVLDQVNDLPGALAHSTRAASGRTVSRRVRRRGSCTRSVRRCGSASERPRRVFIHRSTCVGGDLLMRAGFALPVADVETLDVHYANLSACSPICAAWRRTICSRSSP